MNVAFTKMEGLGNDFVLLDDRTGAIERHRPYPELAVELCSQHFGIGADGIIVIRNSPTEVIGFRIFNADGSEAQMCGNGMRCFAKLLFESGIISTPRFHVETRAGRVSPELLLDDAGAVTAVRVDMGIPVLEPEKVPFLEARPGTVQQAITVEGTDRAITPVSMGNPHAVLFVPDAAAVDVPKEGPAIETHPRFPEKTNVEFINVVSPREINMRVWERGAGETLACGTGACAALVAAHLNGKCDARATVHLAGGDLDIEWDRQTNHIYKTGPANRVFQGEIAL